ncbi:basic amino acid ABC transporter substrate-binding protein [Synergistales bacterium]|nr:basic amino acid ABC transporter substrate-binding protein [Synergistales bacterium]
MKVFFKKVCIVSSLVLFVMGVTCVVLSPSSEAAEGALKGKTLRVAIEAAFAPFESATADGGFEGLDIDILNAIAERLGFDVEISDMAFEGLVGALNSGRADFVISGISPTTERKKIIDASTSYFYPTIAIVSRTESPYPTVESLNGHKVAVPFGTAYEARATSFPGVTVAPINGTTAVLQELLSTRVDAAVLDGCQAAEFLKMYPDKIEFHLLPIEQDIENSYAILFVKNSEYLKPIDAVLVDMLNDGTVDKIIEKWLGSEYLVNYKAGLPKSN